MSNMLKAAIILSLPFWGAQSAFAAENMPLWADLGSWEIRVDTTIGNGCFALAAYEGGEFLRIGMNPDSDNAYLMLGNNDWKSLEEGKDYPISIQFGSEEPWEGEARGVNFGDDINFLWIDFTDDEFIEEFMRKTVVDFSYEGKSIALLKLRGSYKAFSEVMECQTAMMSKGGSTSNTSDPFTATSDSDPFAN